jgi:hypothetical protein
MQYHDSYFLGEPTLAPDIITPVYGLVYNDNGFVIPGRVKEKRVSKWRRKGMPEEVIQSILSFPAISIGAMIDDAFFRSVNKFIQCKKFNIASLYTRPTKVIIEPSVWWMPDHQRWASGMYDPKTNIVHVVHRHYSFEEQFLRTAEELLEWEFDNFFCEKLGLEYYKKDAYGERVEGFPCSAIRRVR